ncbi:MAG: sodium:solute symporter [Vicinamibacterales bacterium]|nr:sodium:solute symporter [Vicinamibacterales bacterium]
MHWIDWLIVGVYLAWIVYTGIQHTKDSHEIEGYFLANRSLPWWAVGLSVMATQLSAITMIGTTGQAYADGMRFLQFYYALPIAMIVLSVTFVPFFHKARVFTAYEYLERRFDAKTRSLTSFLFLLSRGMSCGVVISAPAVVLSVVFGWNLTLTCLAIGLPTALYTMYGGVQAVTWTDVKQMFLIVGGLAAAVIALVVGLPDGVGLGDALHIAGATGKLNTFDFTFSLTDPYTFWSGTIAALFLFLSYFGTDQSQVQRYLTAKSIDEARSSLLMSAYWKIPLQALVLLVGVLLFVFYLFVPTPLLFNKVDESRIRGSAQAAEFAALEARYDAARESRGRAAVALTEARRSGDEAATTARVEEFRAAEGQVKTVRGEAVALVSRTTGQRYNDVNYVFPTFIISHMPIGVVGLLLAAIFAAAMSSIAAELNSLSTATVIDFYRRFARREASDAHYLAVSKVATAFWGAFACIVAIWAAELGSLIEVVNRFGSFFYGSILGVFLLAVLWRRASGHAAFAALLIGMGTVAYVASATSIAFLWLNVVGASTVFVVGIVLSLALPRPAGQAVE